MSASTTIHLDGNVHSESRNLRPSITLGGTHCYRHTLVINFGRRGKVRIRATRDQVRCLSRFLARLADAHAVACGDRQVAP